MANPLDRLTDAAKAVAALSVCNQLQHSLAAETEALVEIHEEAG
jgi:hypothetical protein